MKMIPFIDLQAQKNRIGAGISYAINRVLEHGKFIFGPEVFELEEKLGTITKSTCISCANGTDALSLVLRSQNIGPNDAVLLPSFTFTSTAEVVASCGATPIFVDVDPNTFLISPTDLKLSFTKAKSLNLNPKMVIAVDLFGLPCDYDEIEDFCKEEGLFLLCDAAQSFGASYKSKNVGSIGNATTTSFFPAKVLGCYGDGGAIFTNDEILSHKLKSLRNHGQSAGKDANNFIGFNSRLDTIQAAILLEKLKIFSQEVQQRQQVAQIYTNNLKDILITPYVPSDRLSVWAQYTIIISSDIRDLLQQNLQANGIPSAIYYKTPIHQRAVYSGYPKLSDLINTNCLSKKVLSIPMHPYLEREVQNKIINTIIQTCEKQCIKTG